MNLLRMLGAAGDTITGAESFINRINELLGNVLMVVILLLAGCGVAFAIYIGFRLAKAEDDGKRKEAKTQLIWSLIAVIIMLGIVAMKDWVFKDALGTISYTYTGTDLSVKAAIQLMDAIGSAVSAIINLAGVALAFMAVYIGVKLIMAEDDGKRKAAKSQLMWVVLAVVIALVLSTAMNGIANLVITSYIK